MFWLPLWSSDGEANIGGLSEDCPNFLNVVCMLYVYSVLAIYWRFSSMHITVSISMVALQWEGIIAEMNQLLNVA
jgi:hypothetical protein